MARQPRQIVYIVNKRVNRRENRLAREPNLLTEMMFTSISTR